MHKFIFGFSILFHDVHMSVFMLVPYCFNCYSFVAFEIRKCDTSRLFPSFSRVNYLGSLWFHTNFKIFLLFCKKCYWDVNLNLVLLHQGQLAGRADAVKFKLLSLPGTVPLISIFLLFGVLQIINWILDFSYKYFVIKPLLNLCF